jgi:hypothetical protein
VQKEIRALHRERKHDEHLDEDDVARRAHVHHWLRWSQDLPDNHMIVLTLMPHPFIADFILSDQVEHRAVNKDFF